MSVLTSLAPPWHALGLALLAAVTMFVGVSSASPATEENGFARGNQLYAAGRFGEAAAAYETQVHRGDYRANLFYNLGNAYHRLGSRGRAILNYRRALLLEPSHAEAAANLAFVGGAPTPTATRPFNIGTDALCWLTAGACWLVVGGVLTRGLAPRGRGLGTWLILAGLAGGTAGAALLWRTGGPGWNQTRAVVVADVPARYSPADNAKVVTKLPEGSEVGVLSAQGAWIYVLLGDGSRAWVSSDKIEDLIPAR